MKWREEATAEYGIDTAKLALELLIEQVAQLIDNVEQKVGRNAGLVLCNLVSIS